MITKSERLIALSEAEQEAIYCLPNFDQFQQSEYLLLSEAEIALANSRATLQSQVYCTLQIGYFKAKQAFFRFDWDEVESDCLFVLKHYFNQSTFEPTAISDYEHFTQRKLIIDLFGYQLWSSNFTDRFTQQAIQLARRDVTPNFIATELIIALNEQKIVRPGYTTLQEIVSAALTDERQRLSDLLSIAVDETSKQALAKLIEKDDALSDLAVLRQDAKDFRWRQMAREREKRLKIESLYQTAKRLIPKLEVSQQNLLYYASLVNFYSIYDLRRLQVTQTQLYLLCYIWLRYRQLTDNLVDALSCHTKQFEDECSQITQTSVDDANQRQHQEIPKVGRLLSLYIDEQLTDGTPFGDVRQKAYKIMPKEDLVSTAQRMTVKPVSKLAQYWLAVDELTDRIRRQLRPLYTTIEFASIKPDSPWLSALDWLKSIFSSQKQLSKRPISECPEATLPKRLRAYLVVLDEKGQEIAVNSGRYEFWLYRQIRKRLKSGELYVDDSLQYRSFTDELVSMDRTADILAKMDIPFLRQPLNKLLDELSAELNEQWKAFNQELKQGKLSHLEFDQNTGHLTWHKQRVTKHSSQEKSFYDQLPFSGITEILRLANQKCQFLSAFTPLQPRYAKNSADTDSLIAVIVAQAMNHGNLKMSRTSDIPYHVLETTYQQYLRQATLQSANDVISNAIADLPIFPYYSFDLDALYGAVDGQKFGVNRPTTKARHSRKYFALGKGVVAYTMLCNHIPLNTNLISAHEYEAHHVFDIWYRNTSDVSPTAITGDMHSINKANFAILYWFGLRFEPRFTSLSKQAKELYCANDLSSYEGFLIKPTDKIDLGIIQEEQSRIEQVIATLGLKEITQGALIRKLCTYTTHNPTRKAIFEFDKLIRSIYTLRYLRDPKIERQTIHSQNRIESYHQLRAAISRVGGKKELTGKTDIEIEISNQCARLIANAVIYYNSAILSKLLTRYETAGDVSSLAKFNKISPAAWRHILLNGHYKFHSEEQLIDLDAMVANLRLEQ